MKTFLKYSFLSIVFYGFFSCTQSQDENQKTNVVKLEDSYTSLYSATQLTARLESGIKQINQDSLALFFEEWNKTVKPVSEEYISQNDTIEAIYTAYKEFYKPLDLLKLGNWEWGNNLNSETKYITIQNTFFYLITDTENFEDFTGKDANYDTIINFRPPVNLKPEKVLYLTPEYEKALNQFLGTESTKTGDGNIMNPSRASGESENRYKIIRSYIPVLHGHWGSYWHLSTHPEIGTLLFNKTLTKAKIFFRVGYQGGEALLEKKGDEWKIKESKATWIE